MTEEEKAEFLSNVSYFWHEKGEIERYSGFSIEKLKEAAPELATAYELQQNATKVFESVMDRYDTA